VQQGEAARAAAAQADRAPADRAPADRARGDGSRRPAVHVPPDTAAEVLVRDAPHAAPPHALPAAVLWDMDGTLVDTEPYWIEEEFALVAEHGGRWSMEQATSLVGNALAVSAAVLRREGGVDLPEPVIVERLLAGVVRRVRERIPWRPGAQHLLAELRGMGVPCALVTMSYRVLAEAVVAALPAGSFVTLVTGDEVTHGKPHPEPYLRAAAVLGVPPGRCVALEDSPAGVASAEAAGVPVVAVPHVVPIVRAPGRSRASTLQSITPTLLAQIAAGGVLDLPD
jgi:HAD superfamily hydrolase (TIGR01509 family)